MSAVDGWVPVGIPKIAMIEDEFTMVPTVVNGFGNIIEGRLMQTKYRITQRYVRTWAEHQDVTWRNDEPCPGPRSMPHPWLHRELVWAK